MWGTPRGEEEGLRVIECVHCGYDLTHAAPAADGRVVCPECGQSGVPLPQLQLRQLARLGWSMCWPLWAGLAGVVTIGVVVLVASEVSDGIKGLLLLFALGAYQPFFACF